MSLIAQQDSQAHPTEPVGPQRNGRLKNQPASRLSQPTTCSKSLFRRRGSLNLRRLKETGGGDSCDSSTENLGSGSSDDLVNTAHKRSKLLTALSNKVNNFGSEVWAHRRNSVESLSKAKAASKSSCESLSKSPIKSPSRTPVTENDPLGALMSEVEDIEKRTEDTHKTVSRVSSEIELDQSGAPVRTIHLTIFV